MTTPSIAELTDTERLEIDFLDEQLADGDDGGRSEDLPHRHIRLQR